MSENQPDARVGEMNVESADNPERSERADGSSGAGGCPATGASYPVEGGNRNQGWWPHRLNLKILAKNPAVADPMGEDFDYARGVPDPGPAGGQARHRAGADSPRRTGGPPTSATTAPS